MATNVQAKFRGLKELVILLSLAAACSGVPYFVKPDNQLCTDTETIDTLKECKEAIRLLDLPFYGTESSPYHPKGCFSVKFPSSWSDVWTHDISISSQPSYWNTHSAGSTSDHGITYPICKKGWAEGQLEKHNTYRNKHHSPSMILDTTLNTACQNHANKLASAGKRLSGSDHDPNRGNVGENIGFSCSGGKTAPDYDDVTDAWYSEEKDYDYQTGDKSASCKSDPRCRGTGHFTQVVWKASTKLGIAKATGKVFMQGRDWVCTWAVARYAPPGNYRGQYTTNVQKP